MDKLFCQKCKRRITKKFFGMGENVIEFEDGYYCEKCAKEKVENSRRKE